MQLCMLFKGPDQWKSHFPHCGGMRQSPIDINTDHVLYNENLSDLKLLNYDTSLPIPPTLINNGHSGGSRDIVLRHIQR